MASQMCLLLAGSSKILVEGECIYHGLMPLYFIASLLSLPTL